MTEEETQTQEAEEAERTGSQASVPTRNWDNGE